MNANRSLRVLFVATTLIGISASVAHAQPRAEIGASLVSAVIGVGDDEVSTIGIPSGGFGIINPGVYASVFAGSHLAIEPQLGFVWASFDGDSEHLLNFVAQFDYFLLGTGARSPYLFAAAGVVNISGQDYTPKSVGVGAGYRLPVGDRLAFRVDGRYTHFTGEFEGDEGDVLAFTVSIGGIFGRR